MKHFLSSSARYMNNQHFGIEDNTAKNSILKDLMLTKK